MGFSATGCGTMLYDERIGQPRGGMSDVDWTVAGMDAVGLVFFFVPGVIAFAIDYYNGALFYPPEHYGEMKGKELNSIKLPEEEISVGSIESLISEEIGATVSLREPDLVTRELSSIKFFWKTYDEVILNS
ncbi:MAG: hypothetical protein HON04_09610 [Planctomicrobium sp.]|nr:hypothetical protein [Planctomicrobium sp.]